MYFFLLLWLFCSLPLLCCVFLRVAGRGVSVSTVFEQHSGKWHYSSVDFKTVEGVSGESSGKPNNPVGLSLV